MNQRETALYRRYLEDVQDLLVEAEVEFEFLPIGVLERIEEFLYGMALASRSGETDGDAYSDAEESLEQAKFYCWYTLDLSYASHANRFFEEFHIDDANGPLKDVLGGRLVQEARERKVAFTQAQRASADLLAEEIERACNEPQLKSKDYDLKKRIALERASRNPELRNLMRSSYEAAKSYCEVFVNNQDKISKRLDELEGETNMGILSTTKDAVDALDTILDLANNVHKVLKPL